MVRHLIAGLALASLVTACSSGVGTPAFGPGMIPSVSRPDANTASGTVKVKIVIPARTALRSRYVSPSTKSIVIKVYSSKHKLLASKTQNLIAGKRGCKKGSPVVCIFAFSVPAGKDRFYATTYDRAKGKGNALSVLSNFARTVKPGKTVKLPLALNGVPRSVTLEVADGNAFETGDSTSGFQFAGLIGQTMQVAALDADGNIIAGPGAPTLGLAGSDTTNLSIAAVAGTTNDFLVTPKGDASGITLTASAKPIGKGSTVQTTASLSVGSVLYVANYGASVADKGSVTAYAPWSATPIETITSGINEPAVVTVDGHGNLWVANDAGGFATPPASPPGTIAEYAPASTTPSRTITGVNEPNTSGGESLAIDKSGNVYCACEDASEVDEFTPAGGSTPSRSLTTTSSPSGINEPYSVITDASGNLYVANYGSNAVGISKFGPTGTTPLANITNGVNGVWLLAMDKAGNLYGGNYSSSPNTVTEYASGTNTLVKTFGSTTGIASIYALTVDTSGNVYAGNYIGTTTSNVTQFAAASPASPSRTLPMPNAAPYAVAADPIGNVYVPVSNANTVLVYPRGTSTTASRTLTSANGINDPWYVTSWP